MLVGSAAWNYALLIRQTGNVTLKDYARVFSLRGLHFIDNICVIVLYVKISNNAGIIINRHNAQTFLC